MKCSKCNNNSVLRVKNSRYRNGLFIRTRVCDSCGYKTITVEIPYEMYRGISGFIESFRKMFKTV